MEEIGFGVTTSAGPRDESRNSCDTDISRREIFWHGQKVNVGVDDRSKRIVAQLARELIVSLSECGFNHCTVLKTQGISHCAQIKDQIGEEC